MSSANLICTIPVFQGNPGKYYVVDGEKYHINFPIHWALNHLGNPECPEDKSGPKECGNCKYFGSYKGVFIGYCLNCVHYYDNFERGSCGLFTYDTETRNIRPYSDKTLQRALYTLPYMKGVNVSEIGDETTDMSDYTVLPDPITENSEDEEDEDKEEGEDEEDKEEDNNLNEVAERCVYEEINEKTLATKHFQRKRESQQLSQTKRRAKKEVISMTNEEFNTMQGEIRKKASKKDKQRKLNKQDIFDVLTAVNIML